MNFLMRNRLPKMDSTLLKWLSKQQITGYGDSLAHTIRSEIHHRLFALRQGRNENARKEIIHRWMDV
ncbi:unnamed protein product, partial [Brassica rapa subsp. trilocularis]